MQYPSFILHLSFVFHNSSFPSEFPMTDLSILLTIAVLGGTGKEGKGLAYRWAKTGYHVHIGSRDAAKAQTAANEIMQLLDGDAAIEGLTNLEAAQKADIAVIAVPYAAHRDTLESVKDALKGKILVDVTVPLVPPKVATVQMPSAGSAAQEAKQILGADAQVCAAFQNISYEHLLGDEEVECDVLVTGTSKEARAEAIKLVEAAGLTGWDAGPLENSVVVEGLTSVLISINKKYGSTHAGIRITGVTK
jgi:NADPH-dependent F420 reductase